MKSFFQQLMNAIVNAFKVINRAIDTAITVVVGTATGVNADKKELHKYLPYVLLALAVLIPGLLYGVIALLYFYAFSITIGILALYVVAHIFQDIFDLFGWNKVVNA